MQRLHLPLYYRHNEIDLKPYWCIGYVAIVPPNLTVKKTISSIRATTLVASKIACQVFYQSLSEPWKTITARVTGRSIGARQNSAPLLFVGCSVLTSAVVSSLVIGSITTYISNMADASSERIVSREARRESRYTDLRMIMCFVFRSPRLTRSRKEAAVSVRCRTVWEILKKTLNLGA
jgi:hypothetical protein